MNSIGRYTVIRKIGSGGMAEVFLARSVGAQGTEKLLVLKKIHPSLAKNAKFIGMFIDEARLAMRLNHSNLVQVYNFEQVEDDYILAMEYVDGVNLLDLESTLRQKTMRFPFGLAAYIAAETAKGLDYAHSRSDDQGEPLEIVHRDVSPHNILISHEGAVKVTDFGVAKARWLHDETVGTVKGKFGYMAPEQAAGERVDKRSDIYALGVVLWEMLVGRPLVKLKPHEDPLAAIRHLHHLSPSQIDPTIPKTLDDLVTKALDRDPLNRFQTVRDMAQALMQYLHSEPDIYDSQTLENWISKIEPAPAISLFPADDSSTAVLSGQRKSTGDHRAQTEGRLGEIEKRQTILVSGQFDIEPSPVSLKVAAEIQRLVGDMAFKSGGVLRQRTAGFAIFLGLLRSSMEDAVQGIRLANDVLDAARALSRDNHIRIGVGIAINRGIVSCLSDSSNLFPRFDVDLELSESASATMEMSRHDEIIADDHVYRLARREYHFEDVQKDRASGSMADGRTGAHRDRSHRVLGAKSRKERMLETEAAGPFYGRDFGMDQLHQSLRTAQSKRTVLLRVIGDMGIGKSRLVSQFLGALPSDSVTVLKTECLFTEQDWPLASAAAVIRETLGLGEGDLGQALFEKLHTLFSGAPKYAARQHAFLEAFLRSPDALWNSYKGGRRELVRRTASGLGVLISLLASDRPLVFVVENAHWLDETSIDVIQELTSIRTSVPLLVLFVGHPSTVSEQRIPDMSTIELKELPDPLLTRLILDRLGSSESMQAIADQILARAQGNPFFANEIVDSLIEQRILVQETVTGNGDTAQFRQARPGIISLPTTMEGIARSRIDALSQNQRIVLRTASAVGASFSLQTLTKLVGENVKESVDSLVTRGMLAHMPPDPDGSPAYHFCQPMVREVAYGGLSAPDQKRIHRAMADHLIALAEQGETVPKVRIAWHLDRCGDTESAGRYYLAAGKESIWIYSDREALKLYDRAIPRLREDSLERLDALIRREWVLRELGRYKEQEEDLFEMERIAQVLGEDTLAAHAKTRQALLKYDLCDFREAARKLKQSLELSIRSGDTTQQIEALRLLAYVAVEEGHLTRALDCCNRALVIIPDEMSDVGLYLRGRSLSIKGFVLINMGHLDQAATPLADALAMFRRLRARRQESLILSNLALLAKARGELTLAIEFLESAIRIDAEVCDVTSRGQKLATLAAIHTELGDFETAHANIRDSRAFCKQNREHAGEVDANLGLARLMILDQDPALAREILENMSRGDVVARSRLRLVQHHQLNAKALLGAGFPALARETAEKATRIAFEAGMDGEAVYSGVLLARILAELGLYNKSLTALNDAGNLLAKLGKVHLAEEVWWLTAVSYHYIGDIPHAENALEKARAEVDRKKTLINEDRFVTRYEKHPIVQAIQAGLGERNKPAYL